MTGPRVRPRHRSRLLLAWLLPAALVACGGPPTPSPMASGTAVTASQSADASQGPIGQVIAAPGSDSSVYAPNPGALVVAIDAGHGGCLDWGVPDPRQRGVRYSEKAMTLAISQQLQAMLEAQGVTVVVTRDNDAALAGDDYPDLGCHGLPWRDVNGDGESGFDPEGAIRTRDELQARLDLANLARADALVSIHINSLTENGVVFDIAATETFYTDETPWGVDVTAPLAQAIQDGVVDEMDAVANYRRQDRGIQAHNLYIVAPPLLETTPDRPDPRMQPTRGALMPSVLTEVGSITHQAEQDLLASEAGQQAAAQGIFDALQGLFADRSRGAAYLVPALEPAPGTVPAAVAGDGPMFWAPVAPAGPLTVRLTNTGTDPWPADLALVGGWEESDQPYLRVPPAALDPLLGEPLPSLAPGESVDVAVTPPNDDPTARGVAWITIQQGERAWTELGIAALQVATGD
ncbi:MAG TPA: N-acetylmuramoyl-L-alanine amidase [Candidatus Limnocylindria bacterium]|nr:N-acetylmuramoyl-L-alanine amidase [Candidatus Limnocylindria bacterium]